MAFKYVRGTEITRDFQNGISETEVLPGNFKGHHHYKVYLKAGVTYQPKETYQDKIVVYIFGKGRGYVTTMENSYNITELAFFFADLDHGTYAVHAVEDMEFMKLVVDMNEYDMKTYGEFHYRLPMFRSLSQCPEYIQDCKGPTTRSWSVLGARNIGRIMIGVCRATGQEGADEGTIEKGHPSVHQWNYCIGDCDFTMNIQGEIVEHCTGGDWSFIPAGLDHSMIPAAGKEVYYVWFEQFTKKSDPSITVMPTEEELNDY